MDTGFFRRLVDVAPKLKTPIQLTGAVVAVVAVVATRVVSPNEVISQIAGGAIGILILVFGLLLNVLEKFPDKDRVRLVITIFIGFCLLIIVLAGIALREALAPEQPRVTADVGVFDDSYSTEFRNIIHPDATLTYATETKPDGVHAVPTEPYYNSFTQGGPVGLDYWSYHDYPPIPLSVFINNPTKHSIGLSQVDLKIENLMVDTSPMIFFFREQNILRIDNQGWGPARGATFSARVDDKYYSHDAAAALPVSYRMQLGDIDQESDIPLAKIFTGRFSNSKIILVDADLSYTTKDNQPKKVTFRSWIQRLEGSEGGNTIPDFSTEFQIDTSKSSALLSKNMTYDVPVGSSHFLTQLRTDRSASFTATITLHFADKTQIVTSPIHIQSVVLRSDHSNFGRSMFARREAENDSLRPVVESENQEYTEQCYSSFENGNFEGSAARCITLATSFSDTTLAGRAHHTAAAALLIIGKYAESIEQLKAAEKFYQRTSVDQEKIAGMDTDLVWDALGLNRRSEAIATLSSLRASPDQEEYIRDTAALSSTLLGDADLQGLCSRSEADSSTETIILLCFSSGFIVTGTSAWADRDDANGVIARYCLGKSDHHEVERSAQRFVTAGQRAMAIKVLVFVGMREERLGQLAAASGDYRLAVHLGPANSSDYLWVRARLSKLS
jgi:hypothetical protein